MEWNYKNHFSISLILSHTHHMDERHMWPGINQYIIIIADDDFLSWLSLIVTLAKNNTSNVASTTSAHRI